MIWLREGVDYVTAGGKRVTGVTPRGSDFRGYVEGESGPRSWYPDGAYTPDAPELAIVGEWRDGPVQKMEVSRVVPGRYGRVVIERTWPYATAGVVAISLVDRSGGAANGGLLFTVEELAATADFLSMLAGEFRASMGEDK